MTFESPDDLKIRVMTRQDLDLAIDWAAAEGWNPGLNDAECFQAADPAGFLMGRLGDEPIASISVVRYANSFGFLGLYIVRPEWRTRFRPSPLAGRHGLSRRSHRGSRRCRGPAGELRALRLVLTHRNVRFGGTPQVNALPNECLQRVTPEIVEAVLAYDRPPFPALRETFLRCWLKPDARSAFAFVEDGIVKGYGVIRACQSGYKIGPLFADGAREADWLFQALSSEANDAPVFLDLPEPNQAAVQLATRHGLSPVFETARMYRGATPDLPLSRTYGISTFELG